MRTSLFIAIVGIILFMGPGCAHQGSRGTSSGELLFKAIAAGDRWWLSIENENPLYYEEIDLGKVIIHLCGSRVKLWAEYNARYPDRPMDLASDVYMFTCSPDRRFPGAPAHVWMVVKVRGGRVLLHKWAAGHELVRALGCFHSGLEDADRY